MTENPRQTAPPWTYPGPNYPPPPQRPPTGGLRRNTLAVVAAATLVAGGIGGTMGVLLGGDDAAASLNTPTATTTAADQPDTKSTDVSAVVTKVAPSVVQVNVRTPSAQGLGSGVIIGSDGRILTNNHVVTDATELTVTLSDGRTVDATVLGTDPGSDLAVIQAEGVSGLTTAKFGDSDSVRVGDEVIAIGSPAGLQGTVTTGIVSALDRKVTVPAQEQQRPIPYADQQSGAGDTVSYQAIQTDASINQGNSGGPLFNSAGEVIGINSAMYSPVTGMDGSAGSVGIGFAIPSNNAQQVIDKL